MSIKSRLKSIEDKAGGGKPELCLFITHSERPDGGYDFTNGMAVFSGKTEYHCQPVCSLDGETLEEFKARACETVFEMTGARPINEAEIMARDNNDVASS